MEVRSNKPHGSPEDRGPNKPLDLTRNNREVIRGAVEKSQAAREARKRGIQSEATRVAKQREVASKVNEVLRERMLSRPAVTDKLDLSKTGLAAADQGIDPHGAEGPSSPAHVEALKAALEAGELFSRERLERAATRLLGAELEV